MPPSTVHLPNGQTLTVSPSFGGLFFKSNNLSHHHNVFPPGWTIILNSEEDEEDLKYAETATPNPDVEGLQNHRRIHRFRRPSLRNDHLFISSISNPSSTEFKSAGSPTRQIAMMLWATLWWYFHQPEPAPQLNTAASEQTPEAGKPKGEWRININREGIFKGKHLLPKLERMGLIASEDSSVGLDPDDGVRTVNEGWSHMFVSRRTFWQLDAKIYLFTLIPLNSGAQFPSASPSNSRPASPTHTAAKDDGQANHLQVLPSALVHRPSTGGAPTPFSSASHLPTFYPPPPLQYTFTGNIRHPIRPKPPRQGEIFYTRYIPSLGQYLSFRVASLCKHGVAHEAPTSSMPHDIVPPRIASPSSDFTIPSHRTSSIDVVAAMNAAIANEPKRLTDVELLHKWMNNPRVAHSWGEQGSLEHQENFLKNGLTSKHSFPVIGCFDGKPFGYFEIYWVKEDRLAAHLGGNCGDWDRGLHVLVGEEEFRGPHRIKVWLSALVHACWLADMRTETVMMEPRVDNEKLRKYCEDAGFHKTGEIPFPHKQSNLLKVRREAWQAPAL